MRVAIFAETFLPKWDGVANTLCHLLDHLALREVPSLMFAPEGAAPRYADTPIVGLPSFAFPLYRDLRLVPPLVNVEQVLADFQPDLVHIVNPAFLGLVGLRHARALGVPVVASYHTDLPGYAEAYGVGLLRDTLWAYFRWLHNQADLNLCPSDFTRKQLASQGFERLGVWSHGVDTDLFNPCHFDAEWRHRLTGGHPSQPLLLYVGRLAPEKRVDLLRPIFQAIPDARLAIVGDGPLRSDLEAHFEGTPTVFTGFLTGKALSSAYASADLFVFPSDSETFGNVVLEAMASGLPTVAAAAGGPVDIVAHDVNGLLFPPEDMDVLVTYVRRCVLRPAYRRRLREAALAFARSQSWELVLDKLLEDYASVVEERRSKTLSRRALPLWDRWRPLYRRDPHLRT